MVRPLEATCGDEVAQFQQVIVSRSQIGLSAAACKTIAEPFVFTQACHAWLLETASYQSRSATAFDASRVRIAS